MAWQSVQAPPTLPGFLSLSLQLLCSFHVRGCHYDAFNGIRRVSWHSEGLRLCHLTRPQGGGSREGNVKVVKADADICGYLPLRSNGIPGDGMPSCKCIAKERLLFLSKGTCQGTNKFLLYGGGHKEDVCRRGMNMFKKEKAADLLLSAAPNTYK